MDKKQIMVYADYAGKLYEGSLDAVADTLLSKVGPDDVVRLRNVDTGKLEWIVGPGKLSLIL